MDANIFRSDLEVLYEVLLQHPAFIIGDKKRDVFQPLYETCRAGVTDYEHFIDAATEMTLFFEDGHTNIELPYSSQDLCLNLKCGWCEEDEGRLVLEKAYEDVPGLAGILRVEGMSVNEMVNALADWIPHENLYLVKSRMIHYPLKNYHMFSEMNLSRLFGKKREYSVTFIIDGKEYTKNIPLKPYCGVADFVSEDNFLSYEILDDTVIMHLRLCIFNDEYKRTLRHLARICNEKNIQTFILDLSENMGGDSSVIEEFIRYTRIDRYRVYEMTDYSSGAGVTIASRNEVNENKQADILLPGNIYCKVSYDTFSSARTFAVTLYDNKIAAIHGMPMGGVPNSYGMPRRMVTPECNLKFRVSRALFQRPDADKDGETEILFPLMKAYR